MGWLWFVWGKGFGRERSSGGQRLWFVWLWLWFGMVVVRVEGGVLVGRGRGGGGVP